MNWPASEGLLFYLKWMSTVHFCDEAVVESTGMLETDGDYALCK